jgi:hypothetical protein
MLLCYIQYSATEKLQVFRYVIKILISLELKHFIKFAKNMVLLCMKSLFSSDMLVTFYCYPIAISGGQ